MWSCVSRAAGAGCSSASPRPSDGHRRAASAQQHAAAASSASRPVAIASTRRRPAAPAGAAMVQEGKGQSTNFVRKVRVVWPFGRQVGCGSDGAATAVAVLPQDGRQRLSAVDRTAPGAPRQPVQAGVVRRCRLRLRPAPVCSCCPRDGRRARGPCRAARRAPLRVELSSAVSALTQPARPRVARPVHEQRLRGRAKGPLLQLWLRQERGAGASRPPLPSSLALTAAVRGCRPRTALAGRAATPRARVCPLTLRGCAQLKFSAYVKSANPFAPPATEDPVVHLA